MFGRLKRVALAVTLGGCALAAASGASAQATSSTGVPATLQRENHASPDKWARTQPSSPSRKTTGDGGGDNAPATSGPHKGELNGKLHMGEWP